MSRKLIVAEGKAVVCPKTSQVLRAGSPVGGRGWSKAYMGELHKAGKIRLASRGPSQEEIEAKRIDELIRGGGEIAATGAEPEAEEIETDPRPASKWAEDPKKLKKKTLEDLILMVLDRDPDAEPPKTKAEAIEILTRSA